MLKKLSFIVLSANALNLECEKADKEATIVKLNN